MNIAIEEYMDHFQERQVDYAFTKQSTMKKHSSFMVGALARLHIKYDKVKKVSLSCTRVSFGRYTSVPNMKKFARYVSSEIVQTVKKKGIEFKIQFGG